jgi:hypothetical protein
MRALALCCLALSAFLSPALAENCDAEHYAAAQRIQDAQAKLDLELGPYEAAMYSGNLRAFDEAAQWTVGPWEDLMATISQERRRLFAIPCSLTGIPDAAKLPPGWDTVRDIGAWQVIEVDRNLTILNHLAGVARKPTAEALAK